ncbi:MAG: leucine-rich repeat domain-containing protein, partial [Bacteroidales bacterium]|nr:leucine-rich repeat domain-containing protein [Bacteroidales bacterium]
MRKLLILLLIVVGIANCALAYDFSAVCSSGQTLFYTITSNEEPYTVQIVSENSSSPYYTTNPTGNLVFPESVEYNGIIYSVTGVGNYAFSGCSGLSTVTIPTSITYFGYEAFVECSGLYSVYYEGDIAAWCGIEFYSSGSNPLDEASDLYFNNELLVDIVIPSGVTKIGDYAFSGARDVASLSIPSSVTSIGGESFNACSGLQTITVESSNAYYDSRENCNALINTSTNRLMQASANAFIPNSVEIIGNDAFMYTGPTTLVIPNSVTTIESYAFYGCKATSISLGTGVTSIGQYAFVFSQWYQNQPDGILYLDDWCVEYKGTLDAAITIQEGTKHIASSAFKFNSDIVEVTLPSTLEDIGEYSFYNSNNITTINILASTPPTLQGYTSTPQNFSASVFSSATVWTPCPAAAVYRSNDRWRNFANIRNEQTSQYNIAVQTEDVNKGDVSGAGSFTCDTEVTLTATPNDGYRFLAWDDGNEDNPRTVVVAGDRTYVASFKAVHTITATAGEHGSISPSGDVSVEDGDSQTFTMTTDYGYRIASILIDGVDVSGQVYNGIYTFTNVTANHTIDVLFEEIPIYTITATVIGNGTITPASDVSIFEGENQSYTIAPSNGNRLVSVVVDGSFNVTEQLVNGVYTFVNVTADHTIVATFEEIPYYTISVSAGSHGTISPSTDVTVMEGGSQTFTFSADACYEIGDVRVDGATVRLDENNTYTFTNVTANHTVEANFAILTYTIFVTASEHGIVTHDGNEDDAEVNCGDSQSFTIVADDSCRLVSVIVDGQNVTSQLVDGVYTFTNVTADHTINVTFEEIPIYTVTVSANNDEYGSVAGGGEYMEGTDATISATPNENYHFVSWDDGRTENPRTFTVMDDNTFVATFARNQCTITALSADPSNGSVTGGGTYDVGEEVVLIALPNAGYRFLSWNDDNTDNPRTIVVDGDSTFIASFRALYTISVIANNDEGGLVSGSGIYDEGAEVVITATPNVGYCFIEWNDASTDTLRTITVTSDSTFVADFSATAHRAVDTTVTSYV